MVKQKQLRSLAQSGLGATLLPSSAELFNYPTSCKTHLTSVFLSVNSEFVHDFLFLILLPPETWFCATALRDVTKGAAISPRSVTTPPVSCHPVTFLQQSKTQRFLFVGGCKHRVKYDIPSIAAAEHVLTKLLFIMHIQPTSFDTCPQAPR